MEEFNSFIKLISTRPGMYGINRVEDINFMIYGFLYASKSEIHGNCISGFGEFVIKKYELKEDIHWCRLIRFYSTSDSHSLKLFRNLFEEFLSTIS